MTNDCTYCDGSGVRVFPATAERKPCPVCVPREIAAKWVKRFGLGFHPDTRGADYVRTTAKGATVRALSTAEAAEYDSDIERLFTLADDPYAIGIAAMESAGLI